MANKTPVDEKEKLSNGVKEKSKRAEGKERHKENKAKQQLRAQNRKEAKKTKAEQSKGKQKVIDQPVLDQQVEDNELSKGTNGATPTLEPAKSERVAKAGTVEPNSSKADKKQKKIESKALKAGLSVEEYLSKRKESKIIQSQDKDTKVPEEKGDSRKESRKNPKNLSNGVDDTVKVVAQDELAALSEKKRIKYSAKASAKGLSLEEYLAKRAQKKNKAH